MCFGSPVPLLTSMNLAHFVFTYEPRQLCDAFEMLSYYVKNTAMYCVYCNTHILLPSSQTQLPQTTM